MYRVYFKCVKILPPDDSYIFIRQFFWHILGTILTLTVDEDFEE